jgi:hypothetical protein
MINASIWAARVTAAECKRQQCGWPNEYFKFYKNILCSTKFEVLIQIKGKGGHCDYFPGALKTT